MSTIISYQDYLDGTQAVLNASQQDTVPYEIDLGFEFWWRKYIVRPWVFSPKYFFDTVFFTKNLPNQKGRDMLEIWPGVWVTAVEKALEGAHVTTVDINQKAQYNTRINAEKHGVSDRVISLIWDDFVPIRSGAIFDTIYWNVPFWLVPKNQQITLLQQAVFDPGYRSIRGFIEWASRYLQKDGRLYIGFSSTLWKTGLLHGILKKNGFKHEIIAWTSSQETHPVRFEMYECFIKN